jgi:hypothetical protein
MNQMLLVLEPNKASNLKGTTYEVEVMVPNSPIVAPHRFYLLFVVYAQIP